MGAPSVERELIAWGRFQPGRPIVVARAPARLDVMGGIADYSGATVLELPLANGVVVALQASDEPTLSVSTGGPAAPPLDHPRADIPSGVLYAGPAGEAPRRLHEALAEGDALWAAYMLGPLAILRAAGLLPTLTGLRLAVWSDVPAGAGVSSSAALEVASLHALQALLGLDVAPLQLALLAQQAEHRVALAPCGIMDQVAATLGHKDHLLMLKCQATASAPAEVLGHRALPRDATVFGINSGVAHRVGGGQYGRVRTAAFMGRAMIAAQRQGDPPDGYLCNLAATRFDEIYAPLLPAEMRGADFLARYGETGDDATRVDPDTVYRVRDCTAHPIYEAAHVRGFLAALDRYEESGDPAALQDAGVEMYRSHESYGVRCGLGTPETDLIVALVREHGPDKGLYGAKITGGGGGGTVAVLGAGAGVHDAARAVADEYARRTGNAGHVIAGSGDGAVLAPLRRVVLDEQGGIHDA